MGIRSNGKGGGQIPGKSVDYYHLLLTFLISFLAWPLTYFLNNAFIFIDEKVRPFWMMASGFALLALVSYGTARVSRIHDWLYYGITLFAFTCMIDTIITLEFNGIISNFMSEYLKFGEPYLLSSWGSAIALFDGTGLYIMYLLMAFQVSNRISWRSTGIYWGSSILNSMVVLLVGVATGKHSPTFCTFLNVPYVLLPIVVLIRAFRDEDRRGWNEKIRSTGFLVATDIFLAFGFGVSIFITFLKGVAALGGTSNMVIRLVQHEPLVLYGDPASFAAIQMLVYLFYLVPIQGISLLFSLKTAKPQFLWELTLLQAGALLQAQFSYIATALDPQTPLQYKSDLYDSTFWFTNLLIVIVPHLLLYRLSFHRPQKVLNKKN